MTADQQARLELIENPEQRDMLLIAIRQGLEIPEFAWQPFPADLQMGDLFSQMSKILDDVAEESSVSVDDLHAAMAHEVVLEQRALRARNIATEAIRNESPAVPDKDQ